VNYNGSKYIELCMKRILESSYQNIELIIIDNSSTDGSDELIKRLYYQYREIIPIKCFFLKRNYGPNVARNLGIKNARGELCLFIDHDAILTKDVIGEMVSFIVKRQDIAALQAKLLLLRKPEKIDTCGTYLTLFGFVTEPCSGKTAPICEKPLPVLGGRGVFMIKKSVLRKVGLFDETFFLGWDETELFWRIWLAGYKVFFVPQAIAYHARSSVVKLNYEGLKNGYKTFVKLLEAKNLFPICCLYSLAWIYLILKRLRREKNVISSFVEQIKHFVKELPNILVERKIVQKYVRKVSDGAYFPFIIATTPINELIKRANQLIS
jgi:GT2 family glycosyltransferase